MIDASSGTAVTVDRGGRNPREWAAIGGVGVAYLAARFLPMVGTTTASVTDTVHYFASSRRGFASRSLWAGARPALYPLLIKLLGQSHENLFLLQAAVAAIAWLALAWLVYTQLHNRWLAATGAVVVLFASLSLDIVQWDRILVTESLTISLAVVLLVVGVRLVEQPSRRRVVAFTLVALAWVLLRDSNGYVVVLIAAAFVIAGVRSPVKRRAFLTVAGALALIFALGITSSNIGLRWDGPLKDVISVRALKYPDRRHYLLEHGLPLSNRRARKIAGHCIVRRPPEYICRVVALPKVYSWIRRDGRATYTDWIFSHPATALADPIRHASQLFGSRVRVDLFSHYHFAPANLAESIFFVRNQKALLVEALVAFGLTIAALRKRRSPLAWAVLVGLLTTYPHMFVVWTFAGLETERHALAASLILRLSIVLAVALAADTAFTRPRARDEVEA